MFDNEGSSRHKKLPCPLPNCGSSDAFAVYENGGGHCYSCKGHVYNVAKKYPDTWESSGWNIEGISHKQEQTYMNNNYYNPMKEARKEWDEAIAGLPLRARGISEETVNKLGIRLVVHGNRVIKHLYPLHNMEGSVIGFKERDVANKTFTVKYMEPTEPVQLHGMPLFKKGGKKVLIVEGELDLAASIDMLKTSPYHKNTAVVSIISGTDSAEKSFKARDNFDFVNSFDSIVVCMDNDKAGILAKEQIANVFDPKKVFICTDKVPYKDPNEALLNGHIEEFVNSVSFPESYKPKGVFSAKALMERALNPTITKSFPYPWDGLNKKTCGAREGEFVAWLAQTGIGKTSFFEAIQYYWLTNFPEEIRTANISLEKKPDDTLRAILGLKVGKILNHPDILPKVVDMNLENEYKELFGDDESDQKFYLYDGWGSIDIDELVSTIRYYVNVLDCNFVFFDHISLAVSDQRNDDERKALDEITTKLAELAIETGAGLHVISHMNDAGQARGSRNIDKVCWMRIDLSRDKNHDDPYIRNVTYLNVDKNRTTGSTGHACCVLWDYKTGHLTEVDRPDENPDGDKLTRFEKGIKHDH